MAGEVLDFTCHGEVIVGKNEKLLKMKCDNDEIKKMYQGHSQSYHGDSGVDLFVTKDTRVNPGKP